MKKEPEQRQWNTNKRSAKFLIPYLEIWLNTIINVYGDAKPHNFPKVLAATWRLCTKSIDARLTITP